MKVISVEIENLDLMKDKAKLEKAATDAINK
jgi:hypothetical protein